MTLSCNSELWQFLSAKKQHELENSLKFIIIEEKLKKLSFELKDDSVTKDCCCKELHMQKRKLVSTKLHRCQKLQLRKLLFKAQKMKQIRHHCTQFSQTKQLMPQCCSLTKNLFAITSICSNMGYTVLYDIIDLY
jgi:hypothetical protein